MFGIDGTRSGTRCDAVAPAASGKTGRERASGPASLLARLHDLIELAKARLVSLVVLTAAVGYLMGSGHLRSWWELLWTVAGTALSAAGAMALNQVLEIERDARMLRTRSRPLPSGTLTPAFATAFGLATAALGVAILAFGTRWLAAALAAAVVLIYTLVYTPLKPRTAINTLVGAVCGALPPMIGWASAQGRLGGGAWILAGVLFLWQVPHFLSLAWLYRDDYARGGFRMLPGEDSSGRTTGLMVVLYTLALVPVALFASINGLTGWIFPLGGVILIGWLLSASLRMARRRTDATAKALFLTTLVFLPLFLALMVADQRTRPLAAAAMVIPASTAAEQVPAALVLPPRD